MSTNDAIQDLKPEPGPIAAQPQKLIPRLKSADLMQQKREVEIDHEGRIYRLRITQLNKLILTA
ncbi:hemin uptake protein HemP [Undibacterium sp. Di26W]|uniref:hemin uptake protein HemP n=1 Tax=Undibacterium sp. Di26W TaxID=3413035 RepID=UPI003BF3F524